MSYFLRFDNEIDLEWLTKTIANSVDKIRYGSNGSKLSGIEDIILRVNEVLTNAVTEKDLDQLGINVVKPTRGKNDEYIPNLCEEHPKYTATRVPRGDCESCWLAYKGLHPMEYAVKRADFERKQRAKNKAAKGAKK